MSDNKKQTNMHVRELYEAACNGCIDSMNLLIDKQQDGQCLRFYPNGRTSAEDDGMIAIHMGVNDDCLIARSGKPGDAVCMDRDVAQSWIVGSAKCMVYLIDQLTEDGSVNWHDASDFIGAHATPGFSVDVRASHEHGQLEVTFFPQYARKWVMPVDGVSAFVSQALLAAKELGWSLDATDDELDAIRQLTDIDSLD